MSIETTERKPRLQWGDGQYSVYQASEVPAYEMTVFYRAGEWRLEIRGADKGNYPDRTSAQIAAESWLREEIRRVGALLGEGEEGEKPQAFKDAFKFNILVRGEAQACFRAYNAEEDEDGQKVSGEELHGISADDPDDEFSQYFDCAMEGLGVYQGWMRFEFAGEKLWTITEYQAMSALSEEELKALALFTQGQWSDGIGEGFEQKRCLNFSGGSFSVSPYADRQNLTISQCGVTWEITP